MQRGEVWWMNVAGPLAMDDDRLMEAQPRVATHHRHRDTYRLAAGPAAVVCRSVIVSMLAISLASCARATDEPARPKPYWPRYDEVVSLGTVEPDLPEPDLTPLPTPNSALAFEIGTPESRPAEAGVWYAYTLGHCGITSPIDFDGSSWIPIAQSADPGSESINSVPGRVRLVDDQTLEFRTSTGFVARLRRQATARWYWICF